MKITLRFVGYLRFEGIESGDVIEVEEGASVKDLLTRQKVTPQHQRCIVPIVNGEEERLTYLLKDGDELQLFLPVGGG